MERNDAWAASIKPINITTFFRSLPGRTPPETATEERAAARERILFLTAELNALMLARPVDPRVPHDLDALSTMIADRSARYTSEDWSAAYDGRSKLEHARGAVVAISAELRGAGDDSWDDNDPWADAGDAEAVEDQRDQR